ncbi:hypothetical protein [Streptomyces sp. NPDC051214]
MASLHVGMGATPLQVQGWMVRDVAAPEGCAAAVAIADSKTP